MLCTSCEPRANNILLNVARKQYTLCMFVRGRQTPNTTLFVIILYAYRLWIRYEQFYKVNENRMIIVNSS